jgi:hypothetical protein
MHLQADQVRNLQRFREQLSNVFQMCEKTLRVRISFTTKNLIAVDRELIEQILLFRCRFLHERRESIFERLEFSGMNFEIWVQTDEIRKRFHSHSLHRPVKSVEHYRLAPAGDFAASSPNVQTGESYCRLHTLLLRPRGCEVPSLFSPKATEQRPLSPNPRPVSFAVD